MESDPIDYVIFEAKGGLNNMARGLSYDQRSMGVNNYADKQVRLAIKGTDQWGSAGMADFANYMDKVMFGKTYQGFLIQHNNMTNKNSFVTSTVWR